MPSSPNYVRDYKQERKTAKKRGETGVGSKSKDATRHRARLKKEKQLGRKLSTDEHVDHKNGMSNSTSNLRVRSAKANTSAGGKKGNKEGKANGALKANKSKKEDRPINPKPRPKKPKNSKPKPRK